MKKKIIELVNFNKLNTIILVLLTFSTFRYHKKYFDLFYFEQINPIKIFGEISFLLLISISLIYFLKLTKKNIIHLVTITVLWFIFSLIFNSNYIDPSYIKKSFQIIYCFFIFLAFKNNNEKLNFKVIENLIIFLIFITTLFSFSYNAGTHPNFVTQIYSLFFIYCFTFLFILLKFKKKEYIYFFFIIFFFIIFLNFEFLINTPYDFLDIELFTRKNNFSWIILFFFLLLLLFKNHRLNNRQDFSLFISIIMFSMIYCSIYIFLIEIISLMLILIDKKFQKSLKIISFICFIFVFIYLTFITFYIDTYIQLLNHVFNYIYNLDNLGIIVVRDQNFSFTYEVSQINYNISKLSTEIYLGLIHRAVLAKIYITNISNSIFMDNNYRIITEFFSFTFRDPNNTGFENNPFVTQFNYYLQRCINMKFRLQECLEYHRFLSNRDSFMGPRILVNANFSPEYLNDLIFSQKFNSPHNQYFDLINNFKFLGSGLILLMLVYTFNIILSKNNNEIFLIITISLLFILNFDNYLFYNYFNVSYFLWMLVGLSLNPNIIFNNNELNK